MVSMSFPNDVKSQMTSFLIEEAKRLATKLSANKRGNLEIANQIAEIRSIALNQSKNSADSYETVCKKLVSEKITELGVKKVINKTKQEVDADSMLEILRGLYLSAGAGLKPPKVIRLKEFKKLGGYVNTLKPKTINLDPNESCLSQTTVHEIAHTNDLLAQCIKLVPYLGYIPHYAGKVVTNINRKIIVRELGHDATANREEFIAHVADKLISENKTWADLHPKIPKLYKLFRGPKLKLKGDN